MASLYDTFVRSEAERQCYHVNTDARQINLHIPITTLLSTLGSLDLPLMFALHQLQHDSVIQQKQCRRNN